MSRAKVDKLMALAVQDNEEGRTAAWLAVKLIREHRLLDAAVPPAADAQAPRSAWPQQPYGPAVDAAQEDDGRVEVWRLIDSKYGGTCRTCRTRYSAGASIGWNKKYGTICQGCYDAL